jgi:hypothetical protein
MRVKRGFSRAIWAMAAACAFGQAGTAMAESAGSASQAAVPIPDISGTWVYPYCCGFEPPASGPGPVLRQPLRSDDGTSLPGGNALYRFVGDPANPILRPWAAEVVRKHGRFELAGIPSATPRNQCWPEGVPFIFANMAIQIIQQPDTVAILYEHDHQFRRARMNEAHPAHVTPAWYGDSVAHYEGDTLVIDTVGIRLAEFSAIDWYGTPYTAALHVTERYRLADDQAAREAQARGAKENRRMSGDRSGAAGVVAERDYQGKKLQLQFMVEDQGAFTVPWSASVTYQRSFSEWPEHVCAESRHAVYVWRDSAVPHADKPDF